jgi:hypothetical protein
MATDGEGFTPEIFRYEAFDCRDLANTLHALEKLARLNLLAQQGVSGDDVLTGDDALLIELATAVHCAAENARHMWLKGEVSKDAPAPDDPAPTPTAEGRVIQLQRPDGVA